MLLTSAAHAHAPAPEHALGAPSYAASLVSRSGSRSRAAADDAAAAAASSAEPLDADLYYINLQRRPDRNAALLRQLDRVGYDRAHVHRINATAHADGAAGCLLSHVAALEAVVARAAAGGGGGGGRPFALVLEDDVAWSDAAHRARPADSSSRAPALRPRRARRYYCRQRRSTRYGEGAAWPEN